MTVEPASDDTDFFNDGVTAADIQSISIDGGDIRGTLLYKGEWESAGFDPDEGVHFMGLHITAATGATIKAGVLPSQGSGMVTLDADGLAVFQVVEDTKQVVVRATKDGQVEERIFDLETVLAEEV